MLKAEIQTVKFRNSRRLVKK